MKNLAAGIACVLVLQASLFAQASALIQRTERPPNIETPVPLLSNEQFITENANFFTRYHLAGIPKIDAGTWRLEVKGEALAKALRLSLADLKRFKQVELVALAYCSGNRRGMVEPHVPGVQWNVGAMGNARWKGVRLKDILKKAGLKPEAVELVFDGGDAPVLTPTPDFRKSLPVKKALDENTLIALEMNGQPLPQNQGFPARLVVPGWTATYWVKHLVSIEAVAKPFDGYWVKTAYRVPKGKFPADAFPSQEQENTSPITSIVVNSLITNMQDGQVVKPGKDVAIKGLAWDGGSGIAKVEISTDEGKTWELARLDRDLGRFSWRGFHSALSFQGPGEKIIWTRATSRDGLTQGAPVSNPGGYHFNPIQKLKLAVE